jgi:hypothetical protein
MAVNVTTPPAGTEDGDTFKAATDATRNGAVAVAPPHVIEACAAPAVVLPGMSAWNVTDAVPDADAGLVLTGFKLRMTVPDGWRVSAPEQETVDPAVMPVTLAVMSVAVLCEGFAGTGTTAGVTVTVPREVAATR